MEFLKLKTSTSLYDILKWETTKIKSYNDKLQFAENLTVLESQ